MRTPILDKNFYPMIKALNDFDAAVKASGKSVKVTLVAERSGGYNYVYKYNALADGVNDALNFRIAERIARDNGCMMLITGENLGQVASQTAEALVVTDASVQML